VHDLETRFGSVLEDWGGDMDRVKGIRDYLEGQWDVPARPAASSPSGREVSPEVP